MATFSATIAKARGERKLTLREVAERCGISMTYLADLEKDRRPPPASEILTRLGDALNVDPVNLIILAAKERNEFRIPWARVPANARRFLAELESGKTIVFTKTDLLRMLED